MKNVITTLLFLLPIFTYAQLGKTPGEIAKELNQKYEEEVIAPDYIRYHYSYNNNTEKYIFTFRSKNDMFTCTNWEIVRKNVNNSDFATFEDEFKEKTNLDEELSLLTGNGFIQPVDSSIMRVTLYRDAEFYYINVSYK